ncbi:hypothetical protein B0675_27430 [Streptomyces sp. M41(2017)]|nr:hypothetical protein B0675_27430 [Streptomyces sp. M41(2017)]
MAEHGWYWQGDDLTTAVLASDVAHDEAAARDLRNPGTSEQDATNSPQRQRDTSRAESAQDDLNGPEQP